MRPAIEKPFIVTGTGLLASLLLAGCGDFTDGATRLGFQLEKGAQQLGAEEGASLVVRHLTPQQGDQCTGPYKVQLDQVGALIVWCMDAQGNTTSSHSTTHHADQVATAQTFIIERTAGAELSVRLERRDGRAVIVAVEP